MREVGLLHISLRVPPCSPIKSRPLNLITTVVHLSPHDSKVSFLPPPHLIPKSHPNNHAHTEHEIDPLVGSRSLADKQLDKEHWDPNDRNWDQEYSVVAEEFEVESNLLPEVVSDLG